MKELVGDLWDFHDKGQLVCITTNYSLNNLGHLVMGGGCALEAVSRFPELPSKLGRMYKDSDNIPIALFDERIITFPTKYEVWKDSPLPLIRRSAKYLVELMKLYDKPIYIPRPGCGLGGLDWLSQVKPVLEDILVEDKYVIITNEL